MVDRAYWRLAGLFESSTVASSPCHSFFGVDRPNWVYQRKALRNRWRTWSSNATPNWEPGHPWPVLSLCL